MTPSVWLITFATITLPSPMIDAIEKSMPPFKITIIMPAEIINISADCARMFPKFVTVKKCGTAKEAMIR